MADQTWQVVAALADPVRRSLYEHVRREHRPVTREEAAHAIDISRNLAAFHLDKLVEVGMLRARYEAPVGLPRGRGRAPKVYEATEHGLTLTVPQRHYELVGAILADAIASDPADARHAAHRHAASLGHAIGAAAPPAGHDAVAPPAGHDAVAPQVGQDAVAPPAGHDASAPLPCPAAADRVVRSLTDLGYEPRCGTDGIVLDNCPFHAIATRHTALICGINVQFITGLLAGLGCDTLRAELRPRPGGCCVRVHPG